MVNIEYIDNLGLINKEDIILYIDLSKLSTEDNSCEINYECKYQIQQININPNKILVEKV